MSVILTLNFLSLTNDSANVIIIIFFDIIYVPITGGVVDNIPWTFTRDDGLN